MNKLKTTLTYERDDDIWEPGGTEQCYDDDGHPRHLVVALQIGELLTVVALVDLGD